MLRKTVLLVILLAFALSLTAFAGPVTAQTQENGIPWWAWLLIILALLIFAAVLILWWLGGPAEEEDRISPAGPPEEVPAPELVETEAAVPALDVELPEVEAEVPALGVEPAEVEELEVEAPAADVELPEVEGEAPGADVDLAEEEVRTAAIDVGVPEAVEADDLKVIEGIGPKISQVLAAAGIATFASLAATTPERIEDILAAESSRLAGLADPTTWPEQAQLAAEGKWDDLRALQDSLVGGRARGPRPT